METILTILAVAVPGLLAWLFHGRAAKLEAQNEYLRKTAERRRKLDERKEVIRKEVEAAEAEFFEKKEASAAEASHEMSVIEADAREKGVAASAMEHLKRLKLVLLACALAMYPVSARADECTDGYSVKAGQALPCDAECLPAPSLMTLIKRSVSLEKLERDHAAYVEAAQKKLAAAQAEIAAERAAREAAEDAAVGDAGMGTDTLVLVGVLVFLVGAAAGAGAYHALR